MEAPLDSGERDEYIGEGVKHPLEMEEGLEKEKMGLEMTIEKGMPERKSGAEEVCL